MSALILLAVLAIGCDDANDNNNKDDTGTTGTDITVQQIQLGEYVDGDDVYLEGLIVTSQVTQDGKGVFVQEPGGGEYSGIYIYFYGNLEDAGLNVGDEIMIAGTISEYYDFTEIGLDGLFDIAVTGSGEPTVDVITGSEDMEAWESCLVAVENVAVEGAVNSYGEAELDNGMKMDNLFYDFSTEDQATYTKVTGPLYYNYSEWKLCPRDENDFEGYVEGVGPEAYTISEVRQSFTDEISVVFEDVVVTSEINGYGGFFVQDQGGGPYSGMYVYLYDSGVTVTPGMVVDITGTVKDYYDTLEITCNSADVVDKGTTQTPVSYSLTEAPADWEVYESALITLEQVEITGSPDDYNEAPTNYGINIDDGFYDAGLTSGQSFSSVTGPLTYYYAYKLTPRSAADFVN